MDEPSLPLAHPLAIRDGVRKSWRPAFMKPDGTFVKRREALRDDAAACLGALQGFYTEGDEPYLLSRSKEELDLSLAHAMTVVSSLPIYF